MGSDREQIRRSAQNRMLVGALSIVALIAAASAASIVLDRGAKLRSVDLFQLALNGTHQAVREWAEHKKTGVAVIARGPRVNQYTVELTATERARSALLRSEPQLALRELMTLASPVVDFDGYMLVARDGTILAAGDPQHVGQMIYQHADESFLDEVLDGNIVLRLPHHRSAAFFPHEESPLHDGATMFAGSRIVDEDGQVLGAIVLIFDAGREFSTIFERSRLGDSGEIYGFNHHAVMINQSRFEPQLREAGMLAPGESSIMNVELTDPGIDVVALGMPEPSEIPQPLTLVAREALEGRSGISVDGYRNYRGVEVVGAWIWDDELQLGIAGEFARDEAYAGVRQMSALIWTMTVLAIVLVLLSSRDAVRRREAELKAAHRRRYQALVTNLPGVVFRVRVSDRGFQYISDQVHAITGYTALELTEQISTDFAGMTHAESRPLVRMAIEHAIESNGSYRVEYPIETKNGETRWLFEQGQIVLDEDGKSECIDGVFVDVTDKKGIEAELVRALNELEGAEDQMDLMFTSAEFGLWKYDFSTNQMYLNESIERALLLAPGSLIPSAGSKWRNPDDWGKRILSLVHPEDRDHFESQWVDWVKGRVEKLDVEYRHRIQDGSYHWVRNFAVTTQRDDDGNRLLGFGMAMDIHELKQLQFELGDARDLAESANRAKSVFLATMSHEIRTPMNAILGYAQVLQGDSSLGDEQRQNIRSIRRSGAHLMELIDDVLDMSKIEADRIDILTEPFSLRYALEECVDMFQSDLAKKQLSFHLDLADDLPDMIIADEKRVRQIVINLVSNAVKFTDSGKISLHAGAEDKHIVIRVSDTGCGIEASDLPSIFEPFQQTSTGARLTQGTGLGLSISRELARLMDGDVSVESRRNKGSTFEFSFGFASFNEADGRAPEPPRTVRTLRSDQPETRVLIADDIEDNRRVARLMLESRGFRVREAADGLQAIEIAESWSPHVILMDVVMPDMDGAEASRRIRLSEWGKDIPIIAVSASALDEERSSILSLGASGFVTKPMEEQALLEVIRRHIDVEYEYVDRDSTRPSVVRISPESYRSLPRNLRQRIREAASRGHITQLADIVAEVAAHDKDVADHLSLLVDDFEMERVLDLVS